MLRLDPGTVERRKRLEGRTNLVSARLGCLGQGIHLEGDTLDLVIGRHPLDRGHRQGVGPDPAHHAIIVRPPGAGDVAADGVFGDVAIVEIGDPAVLVVGVVAGRIVPGDETRLAGKIEPRLEGIGHIGDALSGRRPLVDQKDAHHLDPPARARPVPAGRRAWHAPGARDHRRASWELHSRARPSRYAPPARAPAGSRPPRAAGAATRASAAPPRPPRRSAPSDSGGSVV